MKKKSNKKDEKYRWISNIKKLSFKRIKRLTLNINITVFNRDLEIIVEDIDNKGALDNDVVVKGRVEYCNDQCEIRDRKTAGHKKLPPGSMKDCNHCEQGKHLTLKFER